ncbi:MAG: hypothetical protein IKZ14_01995 [Muribaculaceae bacterium]|nr:hypothetical protein [Muribaculaceae bacterium]
MRVNPLIARLLSQKPQDFRQNSGQATITDTKSNNGYVKYSFYNIYGDYKKNSGFFENGNDGSKNNRNRAAWRKATTKKARTNIKETAIIPLGKK